MRAEAKAKRVLEKEPATKNYVNNSIRALNVHDFLKTSKNNLPTLSPTSGVGGPLIVTPKNYILF